LYKTEVIKTEGLTRTLELMRAFNGMIHQLIQNEMQRQGLSEASNPKILFVLRGEMGREGASQKNIADYLGVAPPTVAVSLKRMEKAGLVRKRVNEQDMRENYIELTDKGVHVADACMRALRNVHCRVLKGFSGEDMRMLGDFYRRMIDNMEQLGARNPGYLKGARKNIGDLKSE
jgi:DNA-binding MarR family transcriptional regulator